VNLQFALARPDLPESVKHEMEATIRRRQLWLQRRGGTNDLADQNQETIWQVAHLFELLCQHV
jgi:hypothetical protein